MTDIDWISLSSQIIQILYDFIGYHLLLLTVLTIVEYSHICWDEHPAIPPILLSTRAIVIIAIIIVIVLPNIVI